MKRLSEELTGIVQQGRAARLAREDAGEIYTPDPDPCRKCGGAQYVRVLDGPPRERKWTRYEDGPDGERRAVTFTDTYVPTRQEPCGDCVLDDGALARMAERCGLGAPVGFEGWRPSEPMRPAERAVRDVLDGLRWCAFLRSGVGSGKTTLARMGGVEALRRGVPVAFWNVPDLLDAIRHTYGESAEQEQYDFLQRRIYNRPLVVLDDLGAHKPTAWATAMLYEIVDRIYRNRGEQSLIVTTNVAPGKEWVPGEGALIDDRILSRLAPGEVAIAGAPDRRREFDV